MDKLTLDAARTALPDKKPSALAVRILINDRDLIDLVTEFEKPLAEREGHPDLAGSHLGLPPEWAFLPSKRLLGAPSEKEPPFDQHGKGALYGCQCGFVECWPLLARITVGKKGVV